MTSRSVFRPKAACSSSGNATANSKEVYSARRIASSSSVSAVMREIIYRPHLIVLSSSQSVCAIRTEVRIPVNLVSLSSAIKAPEMRFVRRISVNSSSSSGSSSNIEISFAILTAFYPELSSFTNAMAFTRGLQTFAGGAINSSELEVVVISDFENSNPEGS